MSGTRPKSALAIHRDLIAERMKAGESFGDVEDAIDDVVGLTQDQKAALWLFALSLRDRREQQLDARAHVAAVQ